MIKVIVVSDIKIYCEGLSHILADTPQVDMVGAEESFAAVIDKANQYSPDVILLDMTMLGSCQFARKITQLNPECKIVALAVPEDEENILGCAEAGIAGYVAREASLDDLIETVIGTQKGEFYCPPKIAACIFKTIQRNAEDQCMSVVSHHRITPASLLTRRERQIYSLMVDGLSNKQISHSLTIEVSTVKNHVHNILVKLDVKSRGQAVTLLQRNSVSGKPEPGISLTSYS